MESIAPQPDDGNQGPARPHPTSVYRYYDGIGILIYVGITKQGIGRNLQHNGKAEWWPFVARQEVDHLPSRPAALLREKELIRAHRPPFNKQHNPSYAEMREAYLAYAQVFGGQRVSPWDIYCALDRRLPMNVIHYEPRRLILRSRLEHGPLAALLQKGADIPAVRGRRRQYGHVERLEMVGPTVAIHCFMSSSKKVRPPEGGIADGEVLMGWAAHNTKSPYPYIRQVFVTEGDFVCTTAPNEVAVR